MNGTASLIESSVQHGMTCVCCHCNRERIGSDEWREHIPLPDERLTHGICPSCIEELYPDIAHLVSAR
jgi:hypothetical protein